MKHTLSRLCAAVASFALLITSMSVNSACMVWLHQPELPEGADSLRRK